MRALPRRLARRRVTLTTLVWNAHANAFTDANAEKVTRALDRWVIGKVQRVTLTEVKGVRGALLDWANRNGFLLLQERGIPDPADERGDTAMLIRVEGPGAVKVSRYKLVEMDQPWMVFQYQQRKAPRRHWHTWLEVDDLQIPCGSHHWPTSGNRAAWRESLDTAKKFLRRGRSLLDGDLNATYDDVAKLADDLAATVRGHQPDWAIVSRGKITDVETLGEGGSDHEAFRYTAEF